MEIANRPLGSSGLGTPVVVLGAMGFDDPAGGDERAVERIEAALACGIRAIDTAPLYGFGRSERVIGRVLRAWGPGPRPRLFTKVGLRWDDGHGEVLFVAAHPETGAPMPVRRDSRPESVRLEVERSLERLGVEQLDLVQVHHRDPQVPIAETMAALADLVRGGRVRAVGVCNYTAGEIEEAAAALGAPGLAAVQDAYSLLDREAERERLPAAVRVGAGFLCYSPLAQGLLAGGHGPERRYPAHDWRAGTARFGAAHRARVAQCLAEVALPIARRHGLTPAQLALAWLLARPGVSAVIAGARDAAQVRENAGAAAIVLEAEERAALGQAFAALPAAVEPGAGTAARARRLLRRVLGRLRGRARG